MVHRSIRRGAPAKIRGRGPVIPAVTLTAGLAIASAVGLLALAPGGLDAQQGCRFGDQGENDVNGTVLPGIGRVTYIGGPHLVCAGGIQIFADSAVAYGDRGMSDFIGSVRYVEAARELRADEARYFSNEGRLQAQGNVRLVDEEQGSSVENGDLVYLLRTEFRDTSEMTVTVGSDGIRPRAVLTPRPDTIREGRPPPPDAAGPSTPSPYEVVAQRIFIRGSGYFAASGDVVIERDSLFAYADSADYDQTGEGLALVGHARVDGESYDLTGRTITMTNPGGDDSEIRALREARLTGEDLLLTAARIVVALQDGDLQRLVATPLARPGTPEADSVDLERPEAEVEEFVLTADSLDVLAPGERLQRVFAAGRARSVSMTRDSLNAEVLPEVARHDWLEGDTVIIRFVGSEPVPPMRSATPADSGGVGEAPQAVDSLEAREGVAVDSSIAAEAVAVTGETPDSTAVMDSTVVAVDTLAAQEAPEEADVEEIIARIDARSLYRLPPDDSTFRAGEDAPAVHYVVGREIRIRLEGGEVQGMSVTGQARGVHLEPLLRGGTADTAGIPPDTAAVRDTAAVPDSGGVGGGAAVPDTGAVVSMKAARRRTGPAAEGPGTKIAGIHARNAPEHQDPPPSGPPEEHPWIRP